VWSSSHLTPRWRRESRANRSLKPPNSLLAGKIQGISSIRGSVARQRWLKRASNQCLTDQFPTHPNREFFAALQGIKSDDQGNFRPDQGKRPLARVLPGVGGEGPLRYCRPGVLPVNPARRNASAIASPLARPGLLRPARVSPGRRRFADPVAAISARAVVGRASGV
jgi:hypothetical protein